MSSSTTISGKDLTPEIAHDLGLLTDAEYSAYQSYVSKGIQSQWNNGSNQPPPLPKYTAEENAAHQKYFDLTQQNAIELGESPPDVTQPGFGSLPKPDPPTLPGAPRPDSANGGDVRVNTAALTTFGANMLSLIPIVRELKTTVNGIDIQPGTFGHAVVMKGSVNGTNTIAGLKGETYTFLDTLEDTFYYLYADARETALEYDSAEELNGMNSSSLSKSFADSFGRINDLNSGSNSGNSNGGSGSGSDSGSS